MPVILIEAPSAASRGGRLTLGETSRKRRSPQARLHRTASLVLRPRLARQDPVCLLDHSGDMLLPRQMTTSPDALLQGMAPDRDHLVVAADWMFAWDWLADWCAAEGLPFVLGHARSMKAIQGGKAQNDTIAAQTIAALLRGGLLPQADVYPATMRATRERLRRRRHRAPKRGARLAHVQHTHSQDHLPALGKTSADTAHHAGVAARIAERAVPKRLEVDLSRLDDEQLRRDVARSLINAAPPHDATALYRRRTVPGSGKIRSRVLLDEIHHSARCPRGQACAASCRLLKCGKDSAGKRSGTAGRERGT
jgi:hypothetical protein